MLNILRGITLDFWENLAGYMMVTFFPHAEKNWTGIMNIFVVTMVEFKF